MQRMWVNIPDVKLYKGWRPYAYIADIKSHDIYDGNIDVKPTQILSHPNYQTDDHKQISWSEYKNFKVLGSQGKLLKINNNSQQGFRFKEIVGTRLMDGIYIEKSLINKDLKTKKWNSNDDKNIHDDIALYTEYVTDILIATYSGFLPDTLC